MSTLPLRESGANNQDISNHYADAASPIKPEWRINESDNSFEPLEDKENMNVTNFFKLDETLQGNIGNTNCLEKPKELNFDISPVQCDSNILHKTGEEITTSDNCENMEEFHDNINIEHFPDYFNDVPEIPSQYTTLKCSQKPRESLLTTFDPLYQTETNINVPLLCKDIINSIVEEALLLVDTENIGDISTQSNNQTIVEMDDITDKVKFEDKDISILHYPEDINDKEKVSLLEESISDVKLQLNASQQIRINLELQLRQKEEVLIKSQAEFSRKEQLYQKEIKQLKEKVENKSIEDADSQLKELQDTVKDLKNQEAKLLSEISHRRGDELEYHKIMEEYEKKISEQVTQLQKFQEDHETVKCHLANLELAFSDLHQKYERTKKIIEGYKSNEDVLKEAIAVAHDTVRKSDEKYETLKSHAKAQIEKSNLEIQAVREHYDAEIIKSNAVIRRLEIKVNSLTDSLDQKTKECVALSALCDEVTGQSVIP